MLDKEKYTNGQKSLEIEGNQLTYFFKNGTVKATGTFENGEMEGEWKFYRETGQLWQVGHFKNGKKNGSWIRYDKNNQLEYDAFFENDKIIKQKK